MSVIILFDVYLLKKLRVMAERERLLLWAHNDAHVLRPKPSFIVGVDREPRNNVLAGTDP